MSTPATIGDLIRERRLARGYSLGQLATKLRRTPADVRRWERGDELPSDDLVPALAQALEVDVAGIEALRPAAEPSPEPEAAEPPSADEVVGSEGREPEEGELTRAGELGDPLALSAPIRARPDAFSDAAATTASAEADLDQEGPDAAAAAAGSEERRRPEAHPFTVGGFGPTAAPPEPGAAVSAEPPTEPIAAPVATLAPPGADAATAEAELAVLGRVPNPLELLFDPHRRWLYWIRYALTVVVLFVLLRVFAWGAGELWTALGQLLDTFRSTDEVDALRLLTGV